MFFPRYRTFNVRRRAEVEQECRNIGAISGGRREDRVGGAQVLGMSGYQRERLIAVEPEAGSKKCLLSFQCDRASRPTMPREQISHFGEAVAHSFLVESALRESPISRRRRVWIRTVREYPLGQLEIVFLDRDLQMPPRAGTVVPHVEHRPLRVVPVGSLTESQRRLVHQLQVPEDVAVKVDVVDHLLVIRLGAALKE